MAQLANPKAYFAQRIAALEAPIAMILHCPACHTQHLDAPDARSPEWTNPPHKSHLCHACGTIWRPCDRATVGVATIESKGAADTLDYRTVT
jgi:hypothetical protein